MPEYDFSQCSNKDCPGNQDRVTLYIIAMPMRDTVSIGATVNCPQCGDVGRITRMASRPAVIIKEAEGLRTTGNSFATKINGQDTHIQFIDHQHTDPQYQSTMLEAARRYGMEGAYHSDKFGRTCVDVL